jgi:alpha-tubulin suppressor-like RCC1 family protein
MFRNFEFGAVVNGVARKCLVVAGLFVGLAGMCAPSAQAAAAISMATGYAHNCAVTSAGGVMCWGYNKYGQLGDNSTTDKSQPGPVIGLGNGISAVTASQFYSCALTTEGTVKCWGQNLYGQLGNGTATNSYTPVAVPGLTGVVAISSGLAHSCALLATGNVKCWGSNSNGQVGNGSAGGATTPVSVIGVSGAIGIATGQGHSCAVLSNKTVQCWGDNSWGQLGNGTTVRSLTRVNVTGLSDATSIAAGTTHTCANTTAGSPKCWGNNNNGQLGNGTVATALLPTPVTGLNSGVTTIAASGFSVSTCAVLTSGDAKCWGNNASGQLGNGNKVNQNIPVSVTGLSGGVSAIVVGTSTACALVPSGLQCWGDNNSGELGVGTFSPIPFPVDVLGLAGSAPPSAPVPLSPITSNTPVYTWKALPSATSYRLNVNGVITTYTAAAVGCDGGVGLCRVTGSYLTPGSYTWYVQGYNSFGDGAWSAGTTFVL